MPPKLLKKSTTFYILPAQHEALARLADKLDCPMGHLVREGIRLVIARYRRVSGSEAKGER